MKPSLLDRFFSWEYAIFAMIAVIVVLILVGLLLLNNTETWYNGTINHYKARYAVCIEHDELTPEQCAILAAR